MATKDLNLLDRTFQYEKSSKLDLNVHLKEQNLMGAMQQKLIPFSHLRVLFVTCEGLKKLKKSQKANKTIDSYSFF